MPSEKGRYGRTIGDVFVLTGANLSYELVKAGLAWWYHKYSDDVILGRLELDEQRAKRGLWIDPYPVPPWKYRHPKKTTRPMSTETRPAPLFELWKSLCSHGLPAASAATGMIGSMSRRVNCCDNACVESFFGTLKRDLISHSWTQEKDKQEIFVYLEVFYNRQRRHSILGYHSPAEYEGMAAVA